MPLPLASSPFPQCTVAMATIMTEMIAAAAAG